FIASSYTYTLWGHPYAIIVLTGEALFISLLLHRKTENMLLLAGIYWVRLFAPTIVFMDAMVDNFRYCMESIVGMIEIIRMIGIIGIIALFLYVRGVG
ncbi:MAG: hypothetical protein RIG63_05715, partial [Coleofasciculus chthonoplastes F3-SA18-01]|uniref:hypothetical protein n=1 Tax=Coleofasciculus chthonoplastes TaxID=64178 RepID=UPI0032F6D584